MTNSQDNIANLSANIKLGVDNRLKELHTSMPGIIQSFDPATQIAQVQPSIRRIFKTEANGEVTLTPTDLPKLINVPVIYPRGGGFSLTFPVKLGDECLLLFSERSLDNWHKFGGVKVPSDKRFHSLSDAMCLVGLSSTPNKIPNYDPDNVVIKKDDDGVYVKIKENNDIEVVATGNATKDITGNETNTVGGNLTANVSGNLSANITGDATVNSQNIIATASASATVTAPISTFNGNVQVNGNLTVSGVSAAPTMAAGTNLTVAGKEMSGHTHSQAPDSSGDTEVNTGPPV